MRRLLVLLLLLNAPNATAQPAKSRPLVLLHITVIDMTGFPPKADMGALITGAGWDNAPRGRAIYDRYRPEWRVCLPRFSLHHELELFVQAGFSPMEALQAATRNPAIYLGELNSQGTVEKGKLANLMLLDRNPLVNIRNTQSIAAVVLHGKYLSKEDLNGLLVRAAELAKK